MSDCGGRRLRSAPWRSDRALSALQLHSTSPRPRPSIRCSPGSPVCRTCCSTGRSPSARSSSTASFGRSRSTRSRAPERWPTTGSRSCPGRPGMCEGSTAQVRDLLIWWWKMTPHQTGLRSESAVPGLLCALATRIGIRDRLGRVEGQEGRSRSIIPGSRRSWLREWSRDEGRPPQAPGAPLG